MPQLIYAQDLCLLDLGDDENVFNPDWIREINTALDQVEAAPGPRALVTLARGKFWSNGLDLDWLAANTCGASTFLDSVHALLARVLTLPVISIIQGHAFAGGAMLALAHDYRVMRAGRGFFCLPEVDISLPFTPGMSALIRSRLSQRTAHTAMTTGHRYGGHDALNEGIVDLTAPQDEVVRVSAELAAPLAGKAGPTLAAIKMESYAQALSALAEPATIPAAAAASQSSDSARP
ncbi:enoyl-CoA hydratase-related protein [Streptomyces sp. 1222.5]|uniref:enoyl-CoA hydratase-related protein n=1 Tax=Streptomyces sp. 1222.5 TaxID=1881026 RepID=UPI003D715B78